MAEIGEKIEEQQKKIKEANEYNAKLPVMTVGSSVTGAT